MKVFTKELFREYGDLLLTLFSPGLHIYKNSEISDRIDNVKTLMLSKDVTDISYPEKTTIIHEYMRKLLDIYNLKQSEQFSL